MYDRIMQHSMVLRLSFWS